MSTQILRLLKATISIPSTQTAFVMLQQTTKDPATLCMVSRILALPTDLASSWNQHVTMSCWMHSG